MARHPDELRADFQQYYGLDLDGIGADYTHAHAAALAAQLPRESRCVQAEDPRAAAGWVENLLAAIEYNTRWLVWAQTKDAQRGANKPKPIEVGGAGDARARELTRIDREHIDEVLGR